MPLFLIVLTLLLFESINQLIIMGWAKNHKKFIYKYLVQDNNHITLEHYIFYTFFPKYISFILSLLIILSILPILKIPIICYISLFGIVLGIRVYYRQIFSDFYATLKNSLGGISR